MKCLTVLQPHATLLMIGGVKPYETRSWNTNWRGPIAIHAGKGVSDTLLARIEPYKSALAATGRTLPEHLPLGCVLGIVEIIDCIPAEYAHSKVFGDFTPGRWAWRVSVLEVFRHPIPYKGALGLWEWPFQTQIPT